MSGYKYSRVEMEREQKARQKALYRIDSLTKSIYEFRQKIEMLLKATPDGVKKSFPQEMSKIENWQSRGIPAADDTMSSSQLSGIAEEAQRIEMDAREALATLIDIREVRREKRERELIQQVEQSEAEMKAQSLLLNRWRPLEYKEIVADFAKLTQRIERGDFVAAKDEMNRLQETVSRLGSETAALEELDSQRSFVLDALRKVCTTMGWKETRKEISRNPRDPVLYEVDTYHAGKIIFHLHLDGIEVQSPITNKEDRCRKEFSAVSKHLTLYGIHTKFEHRAPEDEDPVKMQRGELDLPDEGMELEEER